MGEIEELKAAFPSIEIKELQGGANLYFPNRLITVYFRRKKYAVNNVWAKYSYWQDFIPLVNTLVNPKPKVAHIAQQVAETEDLIALFQAHAKERGEVAKEQLDAYCDHKSKQGVQNCIDHIKRKAEYGQKNNLNSSNIAMLNSLINELQQYL